MAAELQKPVYVPKGKGDELNVLGDHQFHKLMAASTGGACSLIECLDPPGMGIPLHYHTAQDEVFYILEGQYEFMIDGKTIIAGPGDTLYGPRNVPHSWKVFGDASAKMLLLLLPGGEAMFRELHAAFQNTAPTPAAIMEICSRHDVHFLPPGQTEGGRLPD